MTTGITLADPTAVHRPPTAQVPRRPLMPEDPELDDDREQTLPDPDDDVVGRSDDDDFEDMEDVDEEEESIEDE
jgi:hypothetical protein